MTRSPGALRQQTIPAEITPKGLPIN